MSKLNKERIHMNDKYKHSMLKVEELGNDGLTNNLEPNRMIR